MIEIKLKAPIQWGQETIGVLQMREPKAKDLRSLPSDIKVGDLLDLAARLTSQTPKFIDELGWDDTQAVLEHVGNFMGAGPQIGNS